MASVLASAEGWDDIYLGPDVPALDIVHAVRQTKAWALALSIIHPWDDPQLAEEFDVLHEHLSADFPILVGGAGSRAYLDVLKRAGARVQASLPDFRAALAEIRRSPVRR